jgi:hypothetical protein
VWSFRSRARPARPWRCSPFRPALSGPEWWCRPGQVRTSGRRSRQRTGLLCVGDRAEPEGVASPPKPHPGGPAALGSGCSTAGGSGSATLHAGVQLRPGRPPRVRSFGWAGAFHPTQTAIRRYGSVPAEPVGDRVGTVRPHFGDCAAGVALRGHGAALPRPRVSRSARYSGRHRPVARPAPPGPPPQRFQPPPTTRRPPPPAAASTAAADAPPSCPAARAPRAASARPQQRHHQQRDEHNRQSRTHAVCVLDPDRQTAGNLSPSITPRPGSPP